MARRPKVAPTPPEQLGALEAEVALGGPVAAHGTEWRVKCRLHQLPEVTAFLVALWRATEPRLGLQPHERPRVEHVPGGIPCDDMAGVYEEAAKRVGF